jgi:hypothetical protein
MRSPGACDNFDLTRNTLLYACEVTLKTSECALFATSETRLSQAKSTSSTTEGILLVKGSPPDRTRAHLYHPNSDDRPAVRATPAFDPLSRADRSAGCIRIPVSAKTFVRTRSWPSNCHVL